MRLKGEHINLWTMAINKWEGVTNISCECGGKVYSKGWHAYQERLSCIECGKKYDVNYKEREYHAIEG